MKPAAWLGVLFVVVVLGFIVYSTFQGTGYKCEVCVTFNGRTDCRVAGAKTQEHAIRTAVENACAQLASGVADSTRCDQTRPDSVRWIE
jgi:hypothetical protein